MQKLKNFCLLNLNKLKMVLKTFNLDSKTYDKFSQFCKANGISMSKQVNIFIESQIEEEPEVRKEYLKKLERIRKKPGIPFKNVAELRKMIEG